MFFCSIATGGLHYSEKATCFKWLQHVSFQEPCCCPSLDPRACSPRCWRQHHRHEHQGQGHENAQGAEKLRQEGLAVQHPEQKDCHCMQKPRQACACTTRSIAVQRGCKYLTLGSLAGALSACPSMQGTYLGLSSRENHGRGGGFQRSLNPVHFEARPH